MEQAIKVYSRFNAPKGKKANAGSPIYEYEYVDKKTGKLEKVKTNIQEKIQSNLDKTDIKRKILTGEEVLLNATTGEVIRDFTTIQHDSKAGLIDFINMVGSLSEKEVADLLQQVTQGSNTGTKETEANGESTKTNTETPPDSASGDNPSNGGTN